MKLPPDFDTKKATELLAQVYPKLWQCCYPRIYEEPSSCGSYYSPKLIAGQLLSTAIRVGQEGLGGQSQIAELLWASRLANLRVPTYWVGRDMAQAIQQTIPPLEFDWVNTHLPFEAMVFMIPKGVLPHVDKEEGEAMFVSFVRMKNGEEIPTLAPTGPRIFNIMENAFSCFVFTTGGQALMHWTYAPDHGSRNGKINLLELDKLVQDFAQCNHTSYSMWSATLTDADNHYMARVCHFIFGALLLMLTRPEQVTPAALNKKVPGKSGCPPKEFWQPNVVGLHYRIRRLYQGGTHASPRGHWVRGAIKEQAYGEKLLLRRPKWIEPYWRGGDNEHGH